MFFRDRIDAGQQLAAKLGEFAAKNPLILTIPRGGVIVGAEVVKILGGDLDLIITRKIGAPFNPEMAIGAVAQDGTMLLNEKLLSSVEVDETYLAEEKERRVAEIQRRLAAYRNQQPAMAWRDRVVILVDDGIATGFTVTAALRSIRKAMPAELVLAVPVAPPDTIKRLAKEVDRIICLHTPEQFWAVGQFYNKFGQVDDQDVVTTLRTIWAK